MGKCSNLSLKKSIKYQVSRTKIQDIRQKYKEKRLVCSVVTHLYKLKFLSSCSLLYSPTY